MQNLTKMIWVIASITLSSSAWADWGKYKDRYCASSKAVAFPFFEPDVTGRARLCADGAGLHSKLRLRHLIPGNAYTVWWVYIDDPSKCTGDSSGTGGASLTGGKSHCEISDFMGDKPLGIFGRMSSGIAPRNGRLGLYGSLGGMQPSNGSEVWLWVFTHGPANTADGDALARQLLTPEDPNAGAPHLGNLIDEQRGFPAATMVFKQ
ncbi:MAG: hypothetical protein AAF420_15395 [Pseudomonadota bacterium]